MQRATFARDQDPAAAISRRTDRARRAGAAHGHGAGYPPARPADRAGGLRQDGGPVAAVPAPARRLRGHLDRRPTKKTTSSVFWSAGGIPGALRSALAHGARGVGGGSREGPSLRAGADELLAVLAAIPVAHGVIALDDLHAVRTSGSSSFWGCCWPGCPRTRRWRSRRATTRLSAGAAARGANWRSSGSRTSASIKARFSFCVARRVRTPAARPPCACSSSPRAGLSRGVPELGHARRRGLGFAGRSLEPAASSTTWLPRCWTRCRPS